MAPPAVRAARLVRECEAGGFQIAGRVSIDCLSASVGAILHRALVHFQAGMCGQNCCRWAARATADH
jgi:hypothetical protein